MAEEWQRALALLEDADATATGCDATCHVQIVE